MAQFNFDTQGIQEREDFEGLPAGDYIAVVEDSDYRPTKKGDGELIAITLQVVEGKLKGRKIWDNMNIKHPNQLAEKIGKEKFAELLRAVGKPRIQDTAELHAIPVLIRVGADKAGQSVVKRYKTKETISHTMSSKAEQLDTPPWAQKRG